MKKKEEKNFLYQPLTTSIGFALDTNFVGSLYTFAVFDGLYLDNVEVDDGNKEVENGEDCFNDGEENLEEGKSEVTK